MKVLYTVNNYQLGAKVNIGLTNDCRILSQKRIDKSHTEIVYYIDSMKQKEFRDKVLSKRGNIIE